MLRRANIHHQSRWEFLSRLRYQMTFGLFIAIAIPAMVNNSVFDAKFNTAASQNTIIGATIASVLGYIGYRRLQVFPGIASGGYIWTSFSATFGLLAASLLVLRLDFSRVQFLASYVVAVSYYTFIHVQFVVRKSIALGVVPGGATDRLPFIPRVEWIHLERPDGEWPRLNGVIADLEADLSASWNSRITGFVLAGIPVYHVKQAVEQLSGRVEIDHLAENNLGSLNPHDFQIKLKAVIDGFCALCALVVLSPAIIVLGILIRLDSPGPALFSQKRIGFRARPFTVYKFRTMRVAMPSTDLCNVKARANAMTQPNDPRITRIGRFLRKTRLDEIPQLINIVRGEMSLIGPRPEAVALSDWYADEIPFYHYRHIIKPGVTGWAQVNQGHVTDVTDVRQKLHLDFYYVKNFSFWLDMLILFKTARTIVTGHGAR